MVLIIRNATRKTLVSSASVVSSAKLNSPRRAENKATRVSWRERKWLISLKLMIAAIEKMKITENWSTRKGTRRTSILEIMTTRMPKNSNTRIEYKT